MRSAVEGSPSEEALSGPSALLGALCDAQQSAILRLLPSTATRGLRGHTFWPLYWLSRGLRPHPTELSRQMGITAAGCTSLVDHLEEAGFVRRRPSGEDRRQVVLEVTAKGQRVVDEVWSELDRAVEEASRGLPARDLATATRVLRTVADRLRATEGR